jgi:hypothetical protein
MYPDELTLRRALYEGGKLKPFSHEHLADGLEVTMDALTREIEFGHLKDPKKLRKHFVDDQTFQDFLALVDKCATDRRLFKSRWTLAMLTLTGRRDNFSEVCD